MKAVFFLSSGPPTRERGGGVKGEKGIPFLGFLGWCLNVFVRTSRHENNRLFAVAWTVLFSGRRRGFAGGFAWQGRADLGCGRSGGAGLLKVASLI